MTVGLDQLNPLRYICSDPQIMTEGGVEYVLLPKLKMQSDGVEHLLDGLLCPTQLRGYTTKLFLSKSFPRKAANWTVHQILGRQWHTWSWQGVPGDLPLLQMLLCHLDALK